MGKPKRERRAKDPGLPGPRAGDAWKNPEDDPLRDLRPEDDEDLVDPVDNEYVWPDLTSENEEDD